LDVAGPTEVQGVRLEVQFAGGIYEIGNVCELLGAQKGDEIGSIDQPQLGCHIPQAIGQRFLALQSVGIALPEHAVF
jgi:hypothetical protein